MAANSKADLTDGFARISVTLLWAWAASGMGALEWAILNIVIADTWGRPERKPGYVSHLTGPDVVSILELHGLCCNSGGRNAVKTMLKRQVLELHGRKLKINARFPGMLNERQLALFDDLRALHASRNKIATGVAPAPKTATPVAKCSPTAATGLAKSANPVAKSATPVAVAYSKDARALDLDLELTSSSNHSVTDKAPSQAAMADNDDISREPKTPAPAALDLLTAKLLEAVRKIDDRPDEDHLASLDALTGLGNEQLELGVVRILVAIIVGKMPRVRITLGAAVAFAAKAAHGEFEDVSPQELLAQISATKAAQEKPAPAPPLQDFDEVHNQRLAQEQLRQERVQYFKNASKRLLGRVCGITGEELAIAEPKFRAAFGKKSPHDFACFLGLILRGLLDDTLPNDGRGLLRLAQLAASQPEISPD